MAGSFIKNCIGSEEFDPHNSGISTREQLKKMTKERSLEILNCLDNKDKESLMEMFAPRIAIWYPLSKQIDDFFEIYDSKSVTYGELSIDEGSSSWRDGKYVYRNFRSKFSEVEMENGEIFHIIIRTCYVDDESPNMIGINTIFLSENDKTIAKIGPFR